MNSESYFEYDDEDVEASDEAVDEGSDESWEAADEDSEGVDEDSEGVDEGADEDSEVAFEAADEKSDEGADEAADESLDEGFSISASARLAADQDRNRRAEWARRIAADARNEAARAASNQRSITNRIRLIQAGGRTRVSSVGALQGAGVVTAILPNGRRSRMRIIPTMAPIAEVNRLRSVVNVNAKRQAIATGSNSRAINALAVAQSNAVKRLTSQQLKSDKELGKRLVEGDNRLDRRITKELSGGSGVLDKHGKRMNRGMRRLRMRSLMDSVLLASSMPFFSAYGERDNPFSKTNLILTGSLLGWMVGDEAIDMFAGKSPFLKSTATFWSYLAPVLNAGTVYFFLNDKQHQRYISGLTTFDPTAALKGFNVDLTGQVGAGDLDTFKKASHAVVATLIDPTAPSVGNPHDVHATIANGILTLLVDVPAAVTPVTVSWIVDTDEATTVSGVAIT